MKDYGKFLKNERILNNLSQSALSRDTGISQQKISYYESGKYEPPISVCEILADYYGITVDQLIGRDFTQSEQIYNEFHHNKIVNVNQKVGKSK